MKTPMVEIRISNVEKYTCKGCGFTAEFEAK
jgi:lipopolysaccharide biosynthesis regulator YciM